MAVVAKALLFECSECGGQLGVPVMIRDSGSSLMDGVHRYAVAVRMEAMSEAAQSHARQCSGRRPTSPE